jgi:hypothetical protein
MRHILGLTFQLTALVLLPCLITYQLFFGFPLIVMPASLVVGVVIFSLGTWLRGS